MLISLVTRRRSAHHLTLTERILVNGSAICKVCFLSFLSVSHYYPVEPPASYSNTVLDAEEEELRAYAEEHACHEDFGDILCEEAFFLSSDDEDRDFGVTSHAGQCLDGAPCVFLDGRGEQGMDIS